MLPCRRPPCGLIHVIDTVSGSLWRVYSAVSLGSRPISILREDLGMETVFGHHHAAAQQLEEALRDAVKERLAVVLGRRKGRPLDLVSLQGLPAAELLQACRQARLHLPPGEPQPHQLAAALHAWLHAPETAAAAAAARPGSGSGAAAAAVASLRDGWDRPTSLRDSNWMRQSGLGTSVGRGAVAGLETAAAAAGQAGLLPAGRVADAAVGAAAAEDADAEAAEAALRAAAEREAEALFNEELQRRLHQAAAEAASAAAAVEAGAAHGSGGVGRPSTGGGGGGGFVSSATPLSMPRAPSGVGEQRGPRAASPEEIQVLRPPPQQQYQQQQQRDAVHLQPSAVAPPPPPPPPQQQQSELAAAALREPTQFLSTTDLLAAAATGPGDAPDVQAAYGGVQGGGGMPSYGPSFGYPGGESLFDSPPPSTGPPQPSQLVAAVRRSLARLGYGGSKDPASLRSLLLLSRGELLKLVEGFNGGDLDTPGQSREHLAVRLLHMMNMAAGTAGGVGGGSASAGDVARSPAEGEPEELRVSEAQAREGGAAGDRRRAVQWLPREGVTAEAGAGGRWDDERVALEDPRRRQVLAAARRRQQLMAAAAQPEEIATWLVKARAQDVVLLCSDPDAADGTGSLQTGSGSGSSTSYMVLATALSQRHAYACAEAVRYQIRERLEELASESESGVGSAAGGGSSLDDALRGAPSVSGFNGADWLSLEAGRVQVHVLTPQARRYYRLEELLAGGGSNGGGGDGGRSFGPRGHCRPTGHKDGAAVSAAATAAVAAAPSPANRPTARPRMRLFGPWAADGAGGAGRLLDTLETARVDTATES